MTSIFRKAAEALMRRRSSLPGWMNEAMLSVARNPDGVLGRMAGQLLKGPDPAPTEVPDERIRVYIAPTNYAGQGFAWARAVERADPGIGARNVAIALPGGFGFDADTTVPIATVNASSTWADAEWAAARRFTHVLIEAERPMFGRLCRRDLRAEIAALEACGVSVAYLCHGTDIRDPDAHARRTTWSPYPEDPRTEVLREDVTINLQLISEVRRPTFVSTPDLIDDVPWATWCPVVVDPAPFATDPWADRGSALRVVHVSSSSVQKGTALVQPSLDELQDAGVVDYRFATGVAAAQMPAVYADADVVLDQFRLGSYGVAACEAMSAGRVVVGHVLPSVRERVVAGYGLELPIVEATPDTLAEVLRALSADRGRMIEIAAAGPEFVRRVHDGRASARVLIDGWIRADRP